MCMVLILVMVMAMVQALSLGWAGLYLVLRTCSDSLPLIIFLGSFVILLTLQHKSDFTYFSRGNIEAFPVQDVSTAQPSVLLNCGQCIITSNAKT